MATSNAVDEYIAGFPLNVQEKLSALRRHVLEIAPGAEERIAYGIPTYKVGKNVFHFAGHQNHIGLYPGPQAIQAHAKQLAGFKTSKGAIQISFDQELPLALVTRLVKFNLSLFGAPAKTSKPKHKGKGTSAA
jgi:uncharacterized protein YdhG (YjbR/CyaY superfamily)